MLPEVLVLYAYRHHRRKNSGRGGRQDHGRGPPVAGIGASSPVLPGPGHWRRAVPGAGGEQVQPEIPSLPVLLEPFHLDGVVVTADAMHTQPSGSSTGVVTTFSRLWATRRPCTALSRSCRGRTSCPPLGSTPDTGGECDAPLRPSRSPPGWTSRGCSGGSVPTHTRTIKGRRHVEVV